MLKQISLEEIQVVSCKLDERETTINISKVSPVVTIWSSDNTFITKILRSAKKYPEGWKCFEGSRDSEGNITGYFFECPKRSICIRSGKKKVRSSFAEDTEEEVEEESEDGEEI